jgi:spore maturation protein CgeB
MITDSWNGLDEFFTPKSEILTASSAEDVLAGLALSDAQLSRIAHAARERVLSEHTGAQRAQQFENIIGNLNTTNAVAA